MASCCAVPVRREQLGGPRQCPGCGHRGRLVDVITLKALLRPDALGRLDQVEYSFCGTPTCPVVYFTGEVVSSFTKADLKVRVGLKETDDPVPICYCFGHSRASAWEEIRRTGKSTLIASITAHVRAGRCGCEVNNPSGACCLGAVHQAVKEGLARYGCRAEGPAAVATDDCCAVSRPRIPSPTARS